MINFDIKSFILKLINALNNIEKEYYFVEISYKKGGIARERVFCYELYHQLRNVLGEDFPFTLHGELSKRGHEEIDLLNQKIPDFLIHIPGKWDNNEVIIEVKNQISQDAIKEDIQKIVSFLKNVHYHHGILIIYNFSFKDSIEVFKENYYENLDPAICNDIFILNKEKPEEEVEIHILNQIREMYLN